jgi:hypothetical protein
VFEHNDNKVITFLVGVECSSNETSPPTLENAMMNIKNVN